MPVVEIKWLKGRSKEQKAKLVNGLFKLFEENGVKKQDLHILFFDVEKSDWAAAGKMASEQ